VDRKVTITSFELAIAVALFILLAAALLAWTSVTARIIPMAGIGAPHP
jgi:hypothetical protein